MDKEGRQEGADRQGAVEHAHGDGAQPLVLRSRGNQGFAR